MWQIRKIELKANFVAHADAREEIKLTANDWCNATVDITGNSNDKSNNDCGNVYLPEFGVYIKTSLADSVS